MLRPLLAQQTTGNITGRLVDEQGSAVPGVTVTAKNPQTGLTRTETSDAEGIYRLTALPVGIYDLTAELQGFSKVDNKGIVVNVGQTLDVNMTLKVASLSETVTVTGETPLIETSSSSVGGVVDIRRIESLPLNGRQFANLAATIPGVGLGFHSDPTKSTQYAPQINGGAGRNVNYQIDGGDNNDDTVGGLLQAYPLEAIQEFNFVTQRFKAEYGRSNGGVMNIVTKSGTNNLTGSFFESFRDKSMNARTETEKIAERATSRTTAATSSAAASAAPSSRTRRTSSAPSSGRSRTRRRPSTRRGCSRRWTGPLRRSVPRDPRDRQGHREPERQPVRVCPLRLQQEHAALRRGRRLCDARQLGRQHQQVQLDQLESQLGAARQEAERVHLPVRRLRQQHRVALVCTERDIPQRRATGANVNTPQTTEQQKYQFRDDFSWHVSGMGGLGHDFKAGVNYINEPRLYLTFNTGKGAIFNTHLTR